MNDKEPDIRSLFEPRSIAVIGASHDKTKIGYTVFDNIIDGGFGGNIYPINPKGGEINGHKVQSSISDVKESVDVAIISIPAKYVFDAVKDCAKNGVKHLVIITSGFSEIGNSEEERKIVHFAKEHGMRVLGPNIFGIFSANSHLNATFGGKTILEGHVGILTQSGALGIAMIGKTAIEKIGLSAMVSLGNKSDIDEGDLLNYLARDRNTKTIMMYIEGVSNGEKLLRVLREVTKKKPVVVIKSGRSKRGAMAAASHTGSLAGSDEIFHKVMNQAGVIRAETLEEAFNWCKFMSHAPTPEGERSVIVTNGGGIGVMATDACEKFDVELVDDIELMKDVFQDATPSFGSLKNPIDITGGAKSSDYDKAIGAAAESDRIDAVMALYCETAMFDVENLRSMIKENYEKYIEKGKPIVFGLIGGGKVQEAIDILKGEGIPVFSDVYDSVQVLGALYRFYRYRKEESRVAEDYYLDMSVINDIMDNVRRDKRHFLLAHEARALMTAAGIRMPESRVAKNIEQAIEHAEQIGYPVVLKVVSKDILHKSDAGGVALDLEDKNEVLEAYEAIMRSCLNYDPHANIEGIEVAEMVSQGTELIVGARRDRSFGPVIMFGLGGIYVEVLKDVSFRSLPLDRKETLRMMKETKAYPLLLGVRGEEQRDIDLVTETVLKLGSLIEKVDCITDIEINPLMAYEKGKGVKAVDARILISKVEGCE